MRLSDRSTDTPRKRVERFCLILLLCAFPVLGTASLKVAHAADKVLHVGLLIDGNGGEPVRNAVIVIDGNRIKAVGKEGEVAIPAGSQSFDFKNKTVIPGLVDSHAHYREWHGELYVNNGVTTALDIGANPLAWSFAQREGIATGKIVGPRLYLAGRINGPGGEDTGEGGSRGGGDIIVKTPEEAVAQVKRLISLGVDSIKALEALSIDQLRAMTDEAHKAGLTIATHSVNGIEAVLAGVPLDSIEHPHTVTMGTIGGDEAREKLHEARTRTTDRISSQEVLSYMEEAYYDRTIKAMLAHGTHWDPAMATQWRAFSPNRERFAAEEGKLLARPELQYIPPYFRANNRDYFDGTAHLDPDVKARVDLGYAKLKDFLHRFVQAGGKLETGSDPNAGMPAISVHQEMMLFVEAGLTPMQALQAGTRNAAERMHLLKDFGIVAPGTFADLIVLDANPLDDIANTQRINTVFKDGNAIKPVYHADYRNPIPRPVPDRQQPEIARLDPPSVPEGSGPVALSISGKNFNSTDVVKLNGVVIPSEVKFTQVRFPQNFRRSREMTATVPPDLLKKPGTYTVVVEHPGQGGAVSDPATLIVK